MATSIYITSAEDNSGKSTVALGVMDRLQSQGKKVGVFRPITVPTGAKDYVFESLLDNDSVDLPLADCIGVSYDDVHSDQDAALATIVERFHRMEHHCDAVVIVGSDFSDVASPTELSFNARIAANLAAPVLLVLRGRGTLGRSRGGLVEQPARPIKDLVNLVDMALPELEKEHATLFGVIANRVEQSDITEVTAALTAAVPDAFVGAIPENEFLIAPTLERVMESIDGRFIHGDPALLKREVLHAKVAAMNVENVISRLREGEVVLIPSDRSEMLVAVLSAHESDTFPSLAGIVLYGGYPTPETVWRLVVGMNSPLPIIEAPSTTYETVMGVMETRSRFAADSQRKYDTALALWERHIDAEAAFDDPAEDVGRREGLRRVVHRAVEVFESKRASKFRDASAHV